MIYDLRIMRKYLATLHKRSEHHKKSFALVTSGSFTLLMFAIWLSVNFSAPEVDPPVLSNANASEVEEVTPLESFGDTLASGLSALRQSSGDLWNIFKNLDLSSGYTELREETLDTYVR